jgi:prepilin-type N-terminal cleavage/methylation domain-containing protein
MSNSSNNGFTLIELMLAIMLGVIVMMAAAIPLISMLRQQINYQHITRLQADTAICIRVIRDTVRDSVPTGLTFTSPEDFSVKTSNRTARFYTVSNGTNSRGTAIKRFIYDPDVSVNNDEIELTDSLVNFAATPKRLKRNGTQFSLQLEDDVSGFTESRTAYASIRNDEDGNIGGSI